jgi:hypothetical protein
MAATPDGEGYWLVGQDGGVFAFGSARYLGALSRRHLGARIVGMAAVPDGEGYWLVGQDDGVFAFGSARFYGSASHAGLEGPVTGITATPDGRGYWLVGRDGGVFAFGDARYAGSISAQLASAPIVSLSATPVGVAASLPQVGYDVSRYQCPPEGQIPPVPEAIAIVQVSGGTFSGSPNPCYRREAAWAGARLEAYIYLGPLPSPAPAEALVGPAGECRGNPGCKSYNYGWFWGRHWVGQADADHTKPGRFWLDVEAPDQWSADPGSNAQVILGAVAAIASTHHPYGIYSTGYQWSQITGGLVLPRTPLWVPGAGNARGWGATAASFCAAPGTAFAGGFVRLVQFGYTGAFVGAYTGAPSAYDQDYACPNAPPGPGARLAG